MVKSNKYIFGGIYLLLLILVINIVLANPEYVSDEVLVKFKHNAESNFILEPSVKSVVLSEERVLKNDLALSKLKGLDSIHRLKIKKGQDIDKIVRDLKRDPNIEYAEPNYIVHTNLMPNDANFSKLYALNNLGQTGGTVDADIDAPEAWNITTGSSDVIIAVIDTGVDHNHPDLSSNIYVNMGEIPNNGIDDDGNGFVDDVKGWNFLGNDNDPFDDNGHGTHVSGTIGAVGNNGIGVTGVNWNVKILPIKFLDSFGSGNIADAIGAIQYATLMHADIMSNSWAGGGFSQALKDAISAANDAGILFVAAAGNAQNNNDITPLYPASYDLPNVVAVAATDDKDNLAPFSNYGPETVHLAAPGVSIYSTVPNGSCNLCNPNGYGTLSGTSMATPHVSGVAGLIKAKFPNLKINGIKSRLLGGVDNLPSLSGKIITGGRLNAYNSLEVDNIPPSKISDLEVTSAKLNSVLLKWTAPGDDGSIGKAAMYDIRFSKIPISDANWDNATQAFAPSPLISGASQNFELKGLLFNTKYYFAIKSFDNAGNPSLISNNANGTTKNASIIFSDNMENATNWNAQGLWHLETKRYDSPTKSWAYNTGSPNYNYDIGSSRGTLTSKQIDLSNQNSAILKFKYWYQTESNGISFDKRILQIGINGVFSDFAQLSGDDMNVWNDFQIDISKYAGKSNVQLRFVFDSVDDTFNNFEGWYIDDLILYGDNPAPNMTQPAKKVFNDTFNRPDSNELGNGWNEVKGDFIIRNSVLRNNGNGTHMAVYDNLTGNDMNVSAIFTSVDNNLGTVFGLLLRYQDPENYYYAYRTTGGSSTIKIAKVVNGIESVLIKKAISNPKKNTPFFIEARADQNKLSVYINGALYTSASSMQFASGKSGIYLKTSNNNKNQIIDDFYASYN